MTIYHDDVFQMACDQFQVIADYLNIDPNDRERLMYPKRAMAVTLPVHMDDGSTKTFQGYRVQHHLTLGPTKGGTRFSPDLSMGETAALAIVGIDVEIIRDDLELVASHLEDVVVINRHRDKAED